MGFVGNLLLFAAGKNFTNQSRIDKVIAMDKLAQFFSDSQFICIISYHMFLGSGLKNCRISGLTLQLTNLTTVSQLWVMLSIVKLFHQ